ncbi:YggT family protein [uncultured Clostridium sp.]|uniref:YggT family protein n=1 Tax=uncultured Clostridium sp. TaxID=59620 RepID=UPI00343CB106
MYINLVFLIIRLLTIVLEISILLEVIMSLFPKVRENTFYNIITSFNYPVLKPFKTIQYKVFKNNIIDFSPLFAIMVISYIRMFFNG